MAFERELQVALSAAAETGALSLRYADEGFDVETKPDDSPVTAADKACEQLIAGILSTEFPDDGLLGEEGAAADGSSGRRWIIDPIDGTRDFIRGNRFWANFLALEDAAGPALGIVSFPALGELYWAARGKGAWRIVDGRESRMAVSKVSEVSKAVACVNGLSEAAFRPFAEKLLPFMSRFSSVRSMGGALDAMLICCGQADFWFESSAKPWDLAPLAIIARESGARFLSHSGEETIYGGNAVVFTPGLEAVAREFLELG
ncbi:MAG: inositol monophosphatase [Bryobacteraceae bacterium]|nr:inositol monophosphatase [Bryobacteraceae bacterium]